VSFNDVNNHCDQMKFDRKNWDILWNDVARYIMQRKGNILTKLMSGQQQTLTLYDTTADKALKVFAAGLVSNICPGGEKWMRIEPRNPNASQASRDWHAAASDILLDLFYTSNFYRGIHEDFLDAGGFCTSCLLLEEGKNSPLNFINVPVGFFGIEEDVEGNVDTIYREWQWTARQAEQKWGRERLGKQCREALSAPSGISPKKFNFRQLVRPRTTGVIDGQTAPQNRPYASYYICIEDRIVVEEGGYYEFPFHTSRLLKSNGEVYGRGPGLDVLPEIRMVNAMERDLMIAHERMVKPPWLVSDDSTWLPDNRPDGVNYYDPQGPKPEQVELKNRVDLGERKTEQKREVIRDAFYNQMFQMLTTLEEQKRQKTAYEVQQMVAEKLVLFSPLFARMCEEKFNPMIHRALGIAGRLGYLPPPPPDVLSDGGYQVVYTSKIALAIKAAENQSFATMIQLAEQMAQIDPSVTKVLKWRDGFRRIATNIALPGKLIRSDEEVDKMVAQENAAAAQQQQAETANQAAGAAQKLGPGAQKLAIEKLQAASEGMK